MADKQDRSSGEMDRLLIHKPEIDLLQKSFSTTQTKIEKSLLTVFVQPLPESYIILRYQLTENYPRISPQVHIISDCLSKMQTSSFQNFLETKANELTGRPMLITLVKEAKNYLITSGFAAVDELEFTDLSRRKKKDVCNKKLAKARNKNHKKGASSPTDDITNGESSCQGPIFSPLDTAVAGNYEKSIQKRPSHFIAVRITNQDIIQRLSHAQKLLVKREPLLEKGVFSKETIHLTLCKVGLDTPDAVTHCIDSLNQMKSSLNSILPISPLVINSMSQFYNRAIFAKVTVREDFLLFHKTLVKRLADSAIDIRDEYETFTPHVTIIKVKRPERKKFGSRNIEPSIYSQFLDTVFGEQVLSDLYLCSMDGQRREDGFYRTLHELHFT
ncbi:uncharacterized protein LOC131945987 [Physella acuta]|uniref:uncharacterized protein LOC131945987 n=1 Tax=Physella acuta TaxID=109671 RepID=UPI0027DB94FC|nr:uncharacterized protein LOC131945987 [Physella acuta]XP_059162602.1 uncharacterized protein LOC131945987 [Physella acuta]XP_059162603.1 uncharacterized protein LOC131945987 [Physella acuta]